MAERTYEVPICDLKSPKRNKIFYVRVNQYGEVLEYMAQNVRDYRTVTKQEMQQQIQEYLSKINNRG